MLTPPRNRLTLDGQRFGRLLVLDEAPRGAEHRYWRWRCDCGTETTVAQPSCAVAAANRMAVGNANR